MPSLKSARNDGTPKGKLSSGLMNMKFMRKAASEEEFQEKKETQAKVDDAAKWKVSKRSNKSFKGRTNKLSYSDIWQGSSKTGENGRQSFTDRQTRLREAKEFAQAQELAEKKKKKSKE